MNLFGKLFRKKEELSATERVHGIMQGFIEASHIGMDTARTQTPKQGQLYLVYMFGAIDMLCQAYQLDEAKTISLFQALLEGLLGGYSPEEAKKLTQVVHRASGTPDGQGIMKEGGVTVKMWIGGVAIAPHRLQELLSEINE